MSFDGLSIHTIVIIGASFLIIFLIGYFIPGKIVSKAGFSRWWFLILFIPIVNLISIWIFAFKRWPALDSTDSVSQEDQETQ